MKRPDFQSTIRMAVAFGVALVSIGFFLHAAIFAKGKAMTLKLTTIVDNHVLKAGLLKDWGFSCLVEWQGKNLLFDTGHDPDVFIHNLTALSIDPKSIPVIFLSHIHADHTGGVMAFLKRNPSVKIYVPVSFPDSFVHQMESMGAVVIRVSHSVEILPGMFSTGELPGHPVNEQSLIIRTPEGLVIITGCSHPGILAILKRSQSLFEDPIFLVLGGFHLAWTPDARVREIVDAFKKLGVQYVGPSHCTGDDAEAIFKTEFGKNFIQTGAGSHLSWMMSCND